MKKIFAVLAVVCLCLGGALELSAAPKTMAITYVKSPLNVPSILEKHLGLLEKTFEPRGYRVEHPEITSGAQQTQAMAAGSVQVANCVGGTSVLLAAAQGLDVKIVGIYSRAPEAYNLLVQDPSIASVADLKGKKVAGPKGTVLHQLLLAGLEQADLKATDVEFIEMSIPAATAALTSGAIDAALAAGPLSLKAQENGAKILFDGKGLIEATILIAASGKALADLPELPELIVAVHREALAYADANPEETTKVLENETGLRPDQIEKMRSYYDFNPEVRDSDIEDLRKTMDFLVKAGLAELSVDPADLLIR